MSRINATTTTRMERRAVDGGERRTKCQCVDTDLAGPSTPGLTGLLHWCIDFQRKCVFPWKPHLGRVYPEVGINLRHSGNLMAALGQSHGGARKVKRASAFARHCFLTKHARALSLPLSLLFVSWTLEADDLSCVIVLVASAFIVAAEVAKQVVLRRKLLVGERGARAGKSDLVLL